MEVHKNYSLKNYNTFGIAVDAKQFVEVTTTENLKEVLQQAYASEILLLGGGSNVLFTQNVDATVVHLNLKGKKIVEETADSITIEVAAGENWHNFVRWCVENNYGGLENLSLIPGNVGTAPIQNIGAYGVEQQDCFVLCKLINKQTLEESVLKKEACNFGYRNSIFKQEAKNLYAITHVQYKLTKKAHRLHTTYGAIDKELLTQNISSPSILDISDVIIKIRQSKLPDPKKIGNSGSFFKNPIIEVSKFKAIQATHPEIPHYIVDETKVKLPAGWLIEQAGFKGYRKGDAGVHPKQALVLVNYGEATGNEILALAKTIQASIAKKFSIALEPEVNIF